MLYVVKFNRKLIDWRLDIVIRDTAQRVDYVQPEWTELGNIQAWTPRWNSIARICPKDITGENPRYVTIVPQSVVDLIEDLDVLYMLDEENKYLGG